MRIKITAVTCVVLGLRCVVFGQHHPPTTTATPATTTTEQSITGDWIIHFQAGHQSVSGNLHLETDGERLTGTVETAHTGSGTIENGKWSQQKLSATCVFKKHESVILEGDLKSDGKLAGKYTTEGRTETWQAERKTGASASMVSAVYAQYQGLIGTWALKLARCPHALIPSLAEVARKRHVVGPNRSYIWHAGSFIGSDGKEDAAAVSASGYKARLIPET